MTPEGDPEEFIQIYRGSPRNPDETSWRKFWKWMLPWLNEKRKLGDRYTTAEVEIREADVDIKRAQAAQIRAQTKIMVQTALDAHRIEEQKLSPKQIIVVQPSTTDELEKLIDKLNFEYGGSIRVEIASPEGSPGNGQKDS